MLKDCPNCKVPLRTVSTAPTKVHAECPRCGFLDSKLTLRVDELWAFVSVDPSDGNEGLIAFQGPEGPMPMVCADQARVDSLRPIAKAFARDARTKVRLARFSVKTIVEEYDGRD